MPLIAAMVREGRGVVRKGSWIVVGALGVLLQGCPGPTAPPAASKTASKTANEPKQVSKTEAPPVDTSHTVEQALARGAPRVDVAWGPSDVWSFSMYLSKVEPTVDLPRFESARSGRLLERFEALPTCRDFPEAIRVHEACRRVLKAYLKRGIPATRYAEEMARVFVVGLDVSKQMLPLVTAFMKTLDPSDATYSVRLGGLAKVKGGLATQLESMLIALEDASFPALRDKAILARGLEKHGPKLVLHLVPEKRAALKRALDSLLRRGLDPSLLGPLTVLANDPCWAS